MLSVPLLQSITMALALPPPPPPPPLLMNNGIPLAGFEKFLLTDAAKAGAVCLDGSPGGGYIRRGDPDKWMIVSLIVTWAFW